MSFLKRLFGGGQKPGPQRGDEMDSEAFWTILDRVSRASKRPRERARSLQRELQSCTPEQIARFDHLFDERIEESYTWELWGAAYVIRGGCGDDGFEYFRNWLISEGRKVFEKALRDPDSLADLPRIEDAENEAFGYVAQEVYEELTGGDFPPSRVARSSEPRGKEWEEE
ncbi:MAG: DUF4240 domain-containing protein, partial [Planctomycetota bacterium]